MVPKRGSISKCDESFSIFILKFENFFGGGNEIIHVYIYTFILENIRTKKQCLKLGHLMFESKFYENNLMWDIKQINVPSQDILLGTLLKMLFINNLVLRYKC